jgi:hypothetical protein
MPGATDTLVMVTRVDKLPEHLIPKGLRALKVTATCDFCNERVIYNKANYTKLIQEKRNPVLICMECYADGAHIRQGYRGT